MTLPRKPLDQPGGDSGPRDSPITEATHGNPFFIQELTRHLQEEGRLVETPVTQALLPELALSIPESLRQVVDHRLSCLSEPAERMLRLAAVCTDGFDFPMLRALTSLDEDTLLEAIDEALAARFITPLEDGAERYDFQHAIVRRALYDTWSPSRRIRLHRTLATSLERIYPDARTRMPPHWLRTTTSPPPFREPRLGFPAPSPLAEARHRFAPEQAAAYLRMARDLAVTLTIAERAAMPPNSPSPKSTPSISMLPWPPQMRPCGCTRNRGRRMASGPVSWLGP